MLQTLQIRSSRIEVEVVVIRATFCSNLTTSLIRATGRIRIRGGRPGQVSCVRYGKRWLGFSCNVFLLSYCDVLERGGWDSPVTFFF